MKKLLKYILSIVLFFVAFTTVSALSLSKDKLTLSPGKSESIELFANTDKEIVKIDFTMVYSTYDIPANFNTSGGNTDQMQSGIRHSVSLSEAKSGKVLLGNIDVSVVDNPKDTSGTVSISNVVATTKDGESITLNNRTINVNVTVPEVKKTIDKNMLDRIESTIVEINLEKDKFDYEVTIDSDVSELDLKPIAKDKDTNIDISTQKIADIKDNKITITTKLEDVEQIYTIKVNVKEKEKKEVKVTIDNSEFKTDDTYKLKWIVLITVLAGSLIISMILSNTTKKQKRRKKKRLS